MNKRQRTYDVLRILLWIGMAELAFWVLFFFGNVLIAALKNEAWQSSFLVYENPKEFWWLLLLPVLIALYLFNLHWKNSVLEKSFSIKLRGFLFRLPTPKQSFWRFMIIRTAIVFMVLAIANPQGGSKSLEIEGYGGEIVVVVDISRSMMVRDMQSKRSRLDAAKNALNNMTRNIPGTSLSIVVFAGSAYPHLPMTRDLQSVSSYIETISTDMIRSQGTDIAAAIDIAVGSFSAQSELKLIYLLTDGEDHEGGVDEALARAQSLGAKVHVMALGSEAGGPIPEPKGGVKKDQDDAIVISKPNLELLQNIAESTGGVFVHETNAFPNFAKLLQQTFEQSKQKMNTPSSMRKSYGAIFALQAFILLMIYLFLLEQFKTKEHVEH